MLCRWALGIYGFRFPLLLTSCHMGFSFVALLPFMLREPFLSKHKDTLRKQWKGLVAIGLFMVGPAMDRGNSEARHWPCPHIPLFPVVQPSSSSSAHCLQALNIALNNLSLVLITLSLNQVIRCGLGVRQHINFAWLPECQPARPHSSFRGLAKAHVSPAHRTADIIPP